MEYTLSDAEFNAFRQLISRSLGIDLAESKRALLVSRLSKRLRTRQMGSFAEYYKLITNGREPEELQTALDLVTTNETYFWREPKHFDFLRQYLTQLRGNDMLRIWSAACSSGEEPYSIAMLLDQMMAAKPWELLASDVSSKVLQTATKGIYPLERVQKLPVELLHHYCLRGIEEQQGSIRVNQALRERVRFFRANLNEPLSDIGLFDIVFLRNVLIYFDLDMKRSVVARVAATIKPNGYLFVGHSENVHGLHPNLRALQPAIYQKQA